MREELKRLSDVERDNLRFKTQIELINSERMNVISYNFLKDVEEFLATTKQEILNEAGI